MLEDAAFRELIQRVRSGDGDAAAELVRQFEPEIRRAVRIHLTDNRLRRLMDSVDIWQSVMHDFFLRAAAGQFDLDNPVQLLKLLKTMARNKLIDKARRPEPNYDSPEQLAAVPEKQETPSQIVSSRELLQKMRELLTPEERFLADQRLLGREWAQIGQELKKSPEAVRKTLERAMNRVTEQLGLGGM